MIEVEDLKNHFSSGILKKHCIKAVDDILFQIERGETCNNSENDGRLLWLMQLCN